MAVTCTRVQCLAFANVAQERADEIRELLRQGVSRREIARRLGISATRVQQLAGPDRMRIQLRVTQRTVSLTSTDASPAQVAERVRRALALAKIDVIELDS